MNTVTQTMLYRQALINYANKYGVGLQLMCYKRKKEVTDKSNCVTVKSEYNKRTQRGDIRHEHCNTNNAISSSLNQLCKQVWCWFTIDVLQKEKRSDG